MNVFDRTFYKKAYHDLRFTPDNMLEWHFKEVGIKEGRVGSQQDLDLFFKKLPYTFEYDTYKRENHDVPSNDLHAAIHFYTYGYKEGRIYNNSQKPSVEHTLGSNITQLVNNSVNVTEPFLTRDIHVIFKVVPVCNLNNFSHTMDTLLQQSFENKTIHICFNDIDRQKYICSYSSENVLIYNLQSYTDLVPRDNNCRYVNLREGDYFTEQNTISKLISSPLKELISQNYKIYSRVL